MHQECNNVWYLFQWSDKLQELDFQELVMFLQHLPTQNWTHQELEMVLSRAYMWHSMFNSSPSHLASQREKIFFICELLFSASFLINFVFLLLGFHHDVVCRLLMYVLSFTREINQCCHLCCGLCYFCIFKHFLVHVSF